MDISERYFSELSEINVYIYQNFGTIPLRELYTLQYRYLRIMKHLEPDTPTWFHLPIKTPNTKRERIYLLNAYNSIEQLDREDIYEKTLDIRQQIYDAQVTWVQTTLPLIYHD